MFPASRPHDEHSHGGRSYSGRVRFPQTAGGLASALGFGAARRSLLCLPAKHRRPTPTLQTLRTLGLARAFGVPSSRPLAPEAPVAQRGPSPPEKEAKNLGPRPRGPCATLPCCPRADGRPGDQISAGKGVSSLAEVKIQEGESIESALRRFKRKVQQEDIIREVKRHAFYVPPGEKRRLKSALARKRNRKKYRRPIITE